jgi:4-diphosphocytidyl-2-C-methyl-D-erythritol kinase
VYSLGLDKPTLASLAAELGSDTPFFVYNTPQLCTGRGEIMTPADVDLRGLWLAVAKPENEGVSTKEAYSGIKPKMPAESLTQLLRRDIGEWQGSVLNDFEPHIFEAHPTIKMLKQRMLDAGAAYAAMSGSGSAVFGLFNEKPTLELGSEIFLHIEYIE